MVMGRDDYIRTRVMNPVMRLNFSHRFLLFVLGPFWFFLIFNF